MPRAFHDIEIRIIVALRRCGKSTDVELCNETGLSADSVRRGIEWLRHKGLASIEQTKTQLVRLGERGIEAVGAGLPERQLLNLIRCGKTSLGGLKDEMGADLGPALGIARRHGWVSMNDGAVSLRTIPDRIPAEEVITKIGRLGAAANEVADQKALADLMKRPGYIIERTQKKKIINLTAAADKIDPESLRVGAIDVEAEVPAVYPARRHPLMEVINEIREIFAELGFTEVVGSIAQSSFWNFDALFTPQDHPAREMQDTFFLDEMVASRMAPTDTVRNVSRSHRQVWRRPWRHAIAGMMVLRTHTTCVTVKHLAETRPDEARVFSLGRVFRNEKISYKHLAEFHQIEGVVAGADATLRNLMGIQKEFYKRIGLTRVKFWPTFFPYTEPSLQSMVYNERMGKWIELFGMGIFRPQVVEPLRIKGPVLAWGGGIERIAMLKYGMDDVREFYGNRLGWLRSTVPCR